MQNRQSNSEIEPANDTKASHADNKRKLSQDLEGPPAPRDGMSAESAKFLIGKCTGNKSYKVYGVENEGRYYHASVRDSKGKVVNELLVDKLNGNVKFIR